MNSFFTLLATASFLTAENAVFLNSSSDGLWETPSNWSTSSLPGQLDTAIINQGRVASLASPAPTIDTLLVGNTASAGTQLTIESALSVDLVRVAVAGNGSQGKISQRAGTMSINGRLEIASTNEGADTGEFTISGGAFSCSELLLGQKGNGIFRVIGDAATSVAGGSMVLGDSAQLHFDLGASGVTPLTISGLSSIDSAAELFVDFSLYTGSSAVIPLIVSGSQSGSFAANKIMVTGVTLGFDVRVELTASGYQLIVDRNILPELPSSLAQVLPEGPLAADMSNGVFSFSSDFESSGSLWTPIFGETHVFNSLLEYQEQSNPNRSWMLRTGKGGQIYSLRSDGIGETIAPQWRNPNSVYGGSYAPWVDEVWQSVLVDTSQQNIPVDGSKWFVHGAGVYLKDSVNLTDPFFSPILAERFDPIRQEYEMVNLGQFPHIDQNGGDPTDDHRPLFVMYSKWRNMGEGAVEYSTGFYNFGLDSIDFVNFPWGGVRRTSLEYHFLSNSDGTYSQLTAGFSDPAVRSLATTDGWSAFSNSVNGSTPAMAMVFGQGLTPIPSWQRSASDYRWGHAGGSVATGNETDWRNYLVSTVRHKPVGLSKAEGMWGRTYFVFGDDIDQVQTQINSRQLNEDASIGLFDFKESSAPIVGYRLQSQDSLLFPIPDSVTPEFYLYSQPVKDSSPVFLIEESDGTFYTTWNPYEPSILLYDGSLNRISLLGYALEGEEFGLDSSNQNSSELADFFATSEVSYRASGRDLQVLTGWNVWAETTAGANGSENFDTDGDSDGMTDFLEYALGTNPEVPDANLVLPTLDVTDPNTIGLEYRRAEGRFDVQYLLEFSSNLSATGWSEVPVSSEVLDQGGGVELIGYTNVAGLVANEETCFFRLKVTYRPLGVFENG